MSLSLIRFPHGRFTEAEWRAAFALTVGPEDAAREAEFYSSADPRLRRLDVELTMLVLLALASPELASRVEAYRREEARRRRLPAWRAAEEDVYWRGLLATLEAAFGRGGSGAPGV